MNEKGTISVFLSIVMAAILLFSFAMCDTAEIACEKYNMQNKTDLAIESLLTEYDYYLNKDYGLYGLSVNSAEYYENEFNKLTEYEETEGAFNKISDYSVSKIEIKTEDSLIDTEILSSQILLLSKYAIGEELGEKALDYIKQIAGCAQASEVYNKYKSAGETLDKCIGIYNEFYQYVMGKYEGDIECVNGYSESLVENFVKICRNGAEMGIVGENFTNAAIMLDEYLEKFEEYTALAYSKGKELSENKENLENIITELKNLIGKKGNEDYKSAMEDLISDFENFLKYFDNLKATEELNANLTVIVNCRLKLENVIKEINLAKKEERNINTSVVIEYLSDFEIKIKTSFQIEKIEKNENTENYSIKDRAKELTEGLFENNVQDKEIESEIYKSLPSKSKTDNNDDNNNDDDNDDSESIDFSEIINKDVFEKLKNNIMLDLYITEYFKNLQKFDITRYGYLQGEVEYIIAGKDSEKKNRNGVVTRLTALRTVFNLEHILTDKDKMELAKKVGNSMASAYSEGVGGPLYTAAIIGIWATSESALDVNDLLKGKKVPLIKTKSTWKLDLFSGESNENEDGEDSEKGLSYENYLQILLFFVKKETKLKRIQDIIELNITKFTGNRYYLKNIYTGITCNINYKINLFVMKGGCYDFTIESKRKYV